MTKKKTNPADDRPLFSTPPAAPGTNWRLVDWLLASPNVRTLYLYGPPGIGKTHAALHTGRVERGFFVLTMTEDIPSAELRGHYLPVEDRMAWTDGPCTSAMRRGARLVINEITHAPPEVMSFLHPILESVETARLTLPTNETVQPAGGFHVVVTDNAPPSELPPALRDRFDCVVEVREPHPDALARLDEPFRSAAQRAFALEDERRISLRSWFSVQRFAPELGLADSCLAVFGQERGAQVHDGLVLLKSQLGLA